MHNVTRACFPHVRRNCLAAESKMRAPVMPNGWPKAIAPPLGLMRGSSSGRFQLRMQARLWAANASFSSITSRSSHPSQALAKAFFEASTGPMPMMRGGTPTTAEETILAKGSRPCWPMPCSLAIRRAAAPSFNPLALPAVTVPTSFRKAGRSLAKTSGVVVGLTN